MFLRPSSHLLVVCVSYLPSPSRIAFHESRMLKREPGFGGFFGSCLYQVALCPLERPPQRSLSR